MTFETVRYIALALPEVEESTSWGTPAFKVRRKMICRLREEGDVLVVRIDIADKEYLISSQPDVFFTLPHYDGYPAVLVNLPAVDVDELTELITDSWRLKAPKRVLKEHGDRL